jgi:hypothetical protein
VKAVERIAKPRVPGEDSARVRYANAAVLPTRPINSRRRMSLERLALCHVAIAGRGLAARAAATMVSDAELSGLLIGQTFADTLELSRPLLDIYEEEAHVGPAPSEFARLESVHEPARGLA